MSENTSVFDGNSKSTIKEFFEHIIKHMVQNSTTHADFQFQFKGVSDGIPSSITLNFGVDMDFEYRKNFWIDWHYTPENPFPKLDGDPLVHVKFGDGYTSISREYGARPISYWHENGGEMNSFQWPNQIGVNKYEPGGGDIVAYMLVNENDHD